MSSASWYWDTCVFVAFLNDDRAAYGHFVDHIGQFLDECKAGSCAIYTSTITMAEISRKHMLKSKQRSFPSFLKDYAGLIKSIDVDPNIASLAAAIRGLKYTKSGGEREMGTPDAVHLATALALSDTYGVSISAFHTFDNGKSRGIEGKTVPLLSYQEWCGDCSTHPVAQRVIALNRCRPEHPTPKLPLRLPGLPAPIVPPSAAHHAVLASAAETDDPTLAEGVEATMPNPDPEPSPGSVRIPVGANGSGDLDHQTPEASEPAPSSPPT